MISTNVCYMKNLEVMMGKYSAFFSGIICIAYSSALAVSGIGVADLKNPRIIRAIRIESNAVADSFKIADGRRPAINTHGTHVAFWTDHNGKDAIAVVRSDVPLSSPDHTIKYMVEWSNGADGDIEWLQGDWIWYSIGRGGKGNVEFWRVNAQTCENVRVAMFRYGRRVMRIPAPGGYMTGMMADGERDCRYLYVMPPSLDDDLADTIEMDFSSFSDGGVNIGGG
ncbi:MAG: hypothetical protein GF350_05145 [Chitinivibrionales bacterium]|nr:hypothetical protein [Chitinivibrionales bacterium]